MDFERCLRQLRLMKNQPGHRFYALLALTTLFILRRPVASIAVGSFVVWLQIE